MKFIGQPHIHQELEYLLPELYQTGQGYNFLLRGFSGCGKTTLAIKLAHYLTHPRGNISYMLSRPNLEVNFSDRTRAYILDEAHLLEDVEVFYPVMDSLRYIIIFCTNEFGNLKEPLVNRCLNLSFVNYDLASLRLIFKERLGNIVLRQKIMDELIKSSGGNPRILVRYASNIRMILKQRHELITNQDELVENVLGIKDGLNPLCAFYLQTLLTLGGKASLDRLCSVTRIPKATILTEIEPVLLYQDLISVTSKGRVINVENINNIST